MAEEQQQAYKFGSFCIVPTDKQLFCHGRPVPLPPKVFDTLLLLVESGGRLLEKQEILTRVWKDSMVEEVAIAHAISHIRKALREAPNGSNLIETVPKRGTLHFHLSEAHQGFICESVIPGFNLAAMLDHLIDGAL